MSLATVVSIVEGANLVFMAIEAAQAALEKAQKIGAIVATAQKEGREHFTEDEWKEIQKTDDEPRRRLMEAIANAPKDA